MKDEVVDSVTLSQNTYSPVPWANLDTPPCADFMAPKQLHEMDPPAQTGMLQRLRQRHLLLYRATSREFHSHPCSASYPTVGLRSRLSTPMRSWWTSLGNYDNQDETALVGLHRSWTNQQVFLRGPNLSAFPTTATRPGDGVAVIVVDMLAITRGVDPGKSALKDHIGYNPAIAEPISMNPTFIAATREIKEQLQHFSERGFRYIRMAVYCSQYRHSSVAASWMLREFCLTLGYRARLSQANAVESWPTMYGRCKGRCDAC